MRKRFAYWCWRLRGNRRGVWLYPGCRGNVIVGAIFQDAPGKAINIRDFGAKLDRTTDDWPALKAARDLALRDKGNRR